MLLNTLLFPSKAQEVRPDTIIGGITFVDMGTSVMWATQNLGVDNSFGYPYGMYYAIGATWPRASWSSGDSYFNTWPVQGDSTIDYAGDANCDAVTKELGYQCYTPTVQHFKDLIEVCGDQKELKKDETTGKYTLTLTSQKTQKSITFIYAGYILENQDCTDANCLSLVTSTAGPYKDGFLIKTEYPSTDLTPQSQSFAAKDGYYYNIRPVHDWPKPATSLVLSLSELRIEVGNTRTLTATLTPNSADRTLSWTTSNESVATVSESGVVTAVGAGECVITASTKDGSNLTAECKVSVEQSIIAGGIKFVDMGTSVLWATQNLGVDDDYPYGKYYAAGATEAHTGENTGISWFIDNPVQSRTDYAGDTRCDAATVALGDRFCTPTSEQLEELNRACSKSISQDETTGKYILTLTSPTTGNSISFVYAGYIQKDKDYTDADYLTLITSTMVPATDGYLVKIPNTSADLTPKYQWRAALDGYYYNLRPVYNRPDPATSLVLSLSELKLEVNDSYTLVDTIKPDNALQTLAWTTSNESVATVSESGVVTAVGEGECVITASTTDGSNLTAECKITAVRPTLVEGVKYIDMGTSVMWATAPLGITDEKPYGSLYLFGATEPYPAGSYFGIWGMEKEEWGGNAKCDAATAALGSGNRIPSKTDFEALLNACKLSYEYDYNLGRDVLTLTSNITGNQLRIVGGGYYGFGNDHSDSSELYLYTSTGVAGDDVAGYYFSGPAASNNLSKAVKLQTYPYSYAYQILPVFDLSQVVKAESVTLNATELTLSIGSTSQLEATVEPAGTSNPALEWTTSDEAVATVSATGEVAAIGAGNCTITATTTDGSNVSSSCAITVVDASKSMDFVDMGLSVMWGKYDIGATSVDETGDYFAWGTVDNVNDYTSAIADAYKMVPTGPCTSVKRDEADPTKPYDVATALLGDEWHTPNEADWQELIQNSTVAREKINGVTTACFTSKLNGNKLYMRVSGYIRETSASPSMSTSVLRQTSETPTDLIYNTKYVLFPAVNDLPRYCYWLVPIRPVCKDLSAGVDEITVDNDPNREYDIYDISGRFITGKVTYAEALARLKSGIYIFVSPDGHHRKVAL